jgi:hypothetical protein
MSKSGRKKQKLDPLSYQEALDSSAMSGLISFLNIKPEDIAKHHGAANTSVQPQSWTHINPGADVSTADVDPATPAETPAEDELAPGVLPASEIPPGKKIYRCSTAQEGHSHTEEALYQMLWVDGAPEETSDSRTIAIGWREMARKIRLTDKNAKFATRRLLEKLSLEVIADENSRLSLPRTYRVYSRDAIVERRRRAGMEFVIRGKGIQFVQPRGMK